MLRIWNASLILATGCSAIVGTFLVRSGILSSIHAFVSDPTLNVSFVVLIAGELKKVDEKNATSLLNAGFEER